MTSLSVFAIDVKDRRRIAAARASQEYDGDPPRCFTCVYFHRGPMNPQRKRRRGGGAPDTIEMCKFGNFPVTYKGVCDQWHSRSGERITTPEDDDA